MALPLVPLDIFNGTLTDSSRTSPDGFRYLYSARVSGTQPLPSLPDYNTRTAALAAAAPGTIPLMVQRVDYASVRPEAFSQNLLAYNNGQVRDVAGRVRSPYLVHTAFAAAPTNSYSDTGLITLLLASSLEVQSGGPAIAGRYLDFGDGRGYLAAAPNQALSANYATTGPKRIKVRYTYTNASSLESWFDITVTSVEASPAVTSSGAGGTSASRTNAFDGNVPAIPGVQAGGTAYIQLGAGHTEITKPLIVVEGFDPSSVAPLIQDNLPLRDFLASIQTGNNFSFLFSLYNAGYDIIYLGYQNGTDDIVLNATLVDEHLQGREKNNS